MLRQLRQDEIQIEILADGTIKVTTDPVSAANHLNAEQFLRFVSTLAGGPTKITRRSGHDHTHHHEHGHSHEETKQ